MCCWLDMTSGVITKKKKKHSEIENENTMSNSMSIEKMQSFFFKYSVVDN